MIVREPSIINNRWGVALGEAKARPVWLANIRGSLDINALLAFVFGTIFCSAILFCAMFLDISDGPASQAFITILALAGAGVAAVIPGMINIKTPIVSAGGAIAVFALIFFNEPAIVDTSLSLSKAVWPPEQGATREQVVADHLSQIDQGLYDEAWSAMGPEFQLRYPRETVVAMNQSMRAPLGEVLSRRLLGIDALDSPAGYPPGAYTIFNYISEFAGSVCHQEVVGVHNDGEGWRVSSHMLWPQPVPCPNP